MKLDRRIAIFWTAALAISLVAHVHVSMTEAARRGLHAGLSHALGLELSSHLTIAALLPALYWLQRRWPLGELRNLAIYLLAIVPFSLAHSLGMSVLRFLWFDVILREPHILPLSLDQLTYELAKDVVVFTLLNAGIFSLPLLFHRATPAAPAPAPTATPRPERFAVRQRGREIMVETAVIDWIEAAGNYAVLHVKGDTFEIRSSLARLESELDPKRFVRVHKSHIVNITRVAEVTPWVSGDWRIRLQDGAEVNLSRRYRQRFEALAPVRS
jgi:hypothetical protein